MLHLDRIDQLPTARVDAVIVSCAISAGIHGALVPEHFEEGAGPGGGFVAATVLLAALILALTREPASRAVVASTAVVLAGLIASYVLAVTAGVPFLHPEVEPVDRLALVTKAVEVAGLGTAMSLSWRPHGAVTRQPKGI